MKDNWRLDALCAQMDGELFFPETTHTAEHKKARQICFRCPVREQCLEYALRNRVDFGIWGGTVPLERKIMRRKLRK